MNSIESLPDGADFIARLRSEHRDFFAADQPIVIARAPGRLDVMGGIADYSGAMVCEMPIAEAAFVALQPRADEMIRVRSTADVAVNEITINLRDLPLDYDSARQRLTADETTTWAAYVLGAFVVVACEGGMGLAAGVNILLDSTVPLGKGVSSSAAIEVATLRALTAAAGLEVSHYELATLAQTIENRVVGAPCGLMDQLTAVFGESDHLLKIRCQPEGEITTLAIPTPVQFIGIDSGVRHAVRGASYGDVRVAAFMGYRMIAEYLNLKFEIGDLQQVRVDDPIYGGFLCNIPLTDFQSQFLPLLPEQMRGDEFLERFGGTTDKVTRVAPNTIYAVRAATTHPVEEEHRVRRFIELLDSDMTPDVLSALGDLMYQAHESYNRCGLGSSATDELVAAVRSAGTESGLYGAKITGGGAGGTVVVLAVGEKGIAAAEKLAAQHAQIYGYGGYVFRDSSPGSIRIPTLELEKL